MVGRRVAFAVPGDLATPTGGFAYDRRVIAELRTLGWQVDVIDLGDSFPRPRSAERATARNRLAAVTADTLVIDGLALGVLPDEAAEISRLRPLIALVHHPLALETGLTPAEAAALRDSERSALAAARHVIVTSAATADILTADYGVASARITVAPPGSDPAPWAMGSSDDRVNLLSVGAIVPRKAYDVLVAALASLADLPWRLTIVGDRQRSPDTAHRLDAEIARLGLAGRITFAGAVSEAELAASYLAADVFVLASHFEGYGMAAADAVAYGLPVVATAAGALAQTIPPAVAILVPPGDAGALSEALRTVIVDGKARRRRRDAARTAAAALPRWPATAAKIAQAIEVL